MIVRQAKEIARQWVVEVVGREPGFLGAFFHGSINALSDDDEFPVNSDVDILVVRELPQPVKLGKLIYQGVMLEISYLSSEDVDSAERILGVSYLAGSFYAPSIILDPSGHLTKLQQIVAREYAKPSWVYKRCDHARRKVLANLSGLDEAAPLYAQVFCWLFGAGVTTHILLAAGLQNLTVRKRYVAVQELLTRYGRAGFYSVLLDMLGCTRMSRLRAADHLASLAGVFDAAAAVLKTPVPFAADITPVSRPIAIDGSLELIEGDYHREAVFWIAVTHSRCQQVLYQDASPDVQAVYLPAYLELLADLGITSFADLQKRCRQIEELLPRVWEVAEAIMVSNPERDG